MCKHPLCISPNPPPPPTPSLFWCLYSGANKNKETQKKGEERIGCDSMFGVSESWGGGGVKRGCKFLIANDKLIGWMGQRGRICSVIRLP